MMQTTIVTTELCQGRLRATATASQMNARTTATVAKIFFILRLMG